jgi:5-hydroxyisourate hydrolase
MTPESMSISTHVLDTEHGQPARGITVELYRGGELLAVRETDEDGRIADLAGDDLGPDVYKLVFHPRSPFFRRVEVDVELGEGHHHVPLLLAPYSCAIYRGS